MTLLLRFALTAFLMAAMWLVFRPNFMVAYSIGYALESVVWYTLLERKWKKLQSSRQTSHLK